MKKIHVLHLSTTDESGGAGIAAMNIHCAISSKGIHSDALVMSKTGKAPNVKQISFSHLHFLFLNRTVRSLFFLFGHPDKTSSFNLFGLVKFRELQTINPSILHLHYIGCQFVGFLNLLKWKTPIVWNIHDFWPLSGVEHLPRLKKSGWRQHISPLNAISKTLKNIFWKNRNHIAVFPSNWALSESKSLQHLHPDQIRVIPNIVDTNLFQVKKPTDPLTQFPIRIGLFFADEAIWRVKGMDLAQEALSILPESFKRNIELHFFGRLSGCDSYQGIPCKNYGLIPHKEMANFYHQIDICLVPSRQETFGLIAAESICCGTPVITFSGQGAAELVEPNISGWICKIRTASELSATLVTAISSPRLPPESVAEKLRLQLCPNAIADLYSDLYKQLLG